MKNLLIVISLMVSLFAKAQADYEFTPSGEHFKKAYEHLAKNEYEGAFFYFDKINQSDTLYDLAQLNKLISAHTGKYFKEVVEFSEEMIAHESQYESEAYYYSILAHINLENYDAAKNGIKTGLEKFPLNFKYSYLQAVLLKKEGKRLEAKKLLQSIINQHPQHSPSHAALAKIMGEEGAKTQAILGYQMAIIANRNSTVLRESFIGMEDIMQNNFEVSHESAQKTPFKTINNIITSKLALQRDYKPAMPLKNVSNNVTDLLFNQFSYQPASNDFHMNYYGKFFQEVKKAGLEKGYTLYLLSVIDNSIINKYKSKYQYQIEAFEKLCDDYWFKHVQENKFEVNGVVDDRDYVLNDNGVLTAFGQFNEEGIKVKNWTFLNNNGKPSAETNYNEKGKLQGKNTWFFIDGSLKESGEYEDGNLNGFGYFTRKNGTSQYDGEFTNNELNGEVTIYDNSGIVNMIKTFKNNEPTGPVQEYYSNGRLASNAHLKDGQFDGKVYVFNSAGDTIRVKNFKEGKPTGTFEEYHDNGSIATKGQYSNGKRSGVWREYNYDGSLVFKYNLKDGEYDGDYLEYRPNGDTLVYAQYNNGLLNGKFVDYISNKKKLWVHEYKKGKLKKFTNYSPTGEILNTGKKDYVLNDRFGYKYIVATKKGNLFEGPYTVFWKNGKVKETWNYEKGILNGDAVEYYKWGAIDSKKYYKNGDLHGKFISYYENGKTYAEGYYSEGLKTGEWNYYYANGNIKRKYYFINGKSVGHHEQFSVDGKKRVDYVYKGGLLNRSNVYNEKGEVICSIKTPQGKGEYNFKTVNGKDYIKSYIDAGEHHGLNEYYYPNKKIAQRCHKNHGETHEKFEAYYPDGKPKEMGLFEYGQKEGVWKGYHHNGKLSWQAHYSNNAIRDSIVKYYITGEIKETGYYDENGASLGMKYFHPSGTLNSYAPMDNGFTHGGYNNYDAFGKVMIHRVYNGGELTGYSYMKDGKLIETIASNGNDFIKSYYNNGQVGFEYSEKDGLWEGEYKRYHSNGKPWMVTNYLHGEINGSYKSYYGNGILRFEASYNQGRLNGELKKFDKQGNVLIMQTYLDGVKHGPAKYYGEEEKLLYTLSYKDDVVVSVR